MSPCKRVKNGNSSVSSAKFQLMATTPEEQQQRTRAILLLEAKWVKNVDTKQKALLLAQNRARRADQGGNHDKTPPK